MRKLILAMRKLILILLCLTLPLVALGDDSKLAPDLRNLPANAKVRVIVQYNQPVTSSSGGLLGGLVGGLLNLVGSVLQVLPLVNGIVADLTGSNIVSLSNDSNVTYISPDRNVSMLLSNAAPAINATAAWKAGYTGKGIGVAVIDSGVAAGADLNGGASSVSPRASPITRILCRRKPPPATATATARMSPD